MLLVPMRPMLDVVRNDNNHTYKVNGISVPGCSEIVAQIDPDGSRWFTEESREFGRAVHAAVHYDLQHDLNENKVHPDVYGCVIAARGFVTDHDLVPIMIEQPVGCLMPHCAGTFDTLFQVRDREEYWLPDWKSGGERPLFKVQLAGYAIMLRHTYGIANVKRMAVYLQRNGSYRRPEIYAGPEDFDAFKGAHTIWNWKQKNMAR